MVATFLSTACNQLAVDVIREWNAGTLTYWGTVGHYTIATMAAALLQTPGLKSLMDANVDRISFAAAQINKKNRNPDFVRSLTLDSIGAVLD